MSSGSETRRKQLYVRARCTQEQQTQFVAAAREAGFESVAEFILARCLGPGQGKAAARLPKLDRADLVRVMGLLGKYGSNLNQIARDANSGGEIVRASEVWQLQDQVRELQAAVRTLLGLGRDR